MHHRARVFGFVGSVRAKHYGRTGSEAFRRPAIAYAQNVGCHLIIKPLHMKVLFFLTILLIVTSCKMYYVTADSLKEQLSNVDPGRIREVRDILKLPIPLPVPGTNTVVQANVPIVTGTHMYNGMTEVICDDNMGAKWEIDVNHLSQARVTEKSGRHKIVYFDTMFLLDTLVYASKSHMIHAAIKPPFKIKDITKIELQFKSSKKTKL
jgi:hypothetical protein